MFEANNIGLKGAEALAKSANFKSLEILFMDSNPIGAEGAKTLANSTRLPNLAGLASGQYGPWRRGCGLPGQRFKTGGPHQTLFMLQ